MEGQLNPEQLEAVRYSSGPLLVLAGAGSGKTRVIAHRIAFLVEQADVHPQHILAITFTRKAAGEMKRRVEELLAGHVSGMWIGTFHSVCARILRLHADRLGYGKNFSIYDEDDQRGVVKERIAELGISEREFPPARVLERIGSLKSEMVGCEEMSRLAMSYHDVRVARIYAAYQDALMKNNAMDFDDLLVNTVQLFTEFEDLRRSYADRFRHVLVDEYQDTNHAQYRIIAELCREERNLCVVGDDDQSIYGWRGADIRNILEFEESFPEAKTIRLEQNYRSTGLILEAANSVIKCNKGRKGKTLRTANEYGENIGLLLLGSEEEEAEAVAEEIALEHVERRTPLSEMAVLYRTNAQSRALEMALRHSGINYQIVGSTSFFERKEVKDVLAYVRLCVNPGDDISLRRVLNVPPRRIGRAAITRLQEEASRRGISLLETLRVAGDVVGVSPGARSGIADFLSILDEFSGRRNEDVGSVMEALVKRVGYREHLQAASGNVRERLENLDELVAYGQQFSEERSIEEEDRASAVADFLNDVTLVSQIDSWQPEAEQVTLMTAHNAKGLEFTCVFVTGLEDGLFPHSASMEDGEQLEEERRLFYVALTRARKRLVLSAAARRRRFDQRGSTGISRFVREIPEGLMNTREARDASPQSSMVGKRVFHREFGTGTVVAQEGHGDAAKLTVEFSGNIRKKVLARYMSPDAS
ncbi:MAG: UvrD-helicase domain-containing protein [Candidatus Eiseniibacteriota bacterium]|nr:MAG: UvrD-helicase domain-containing protein [Candidatus Eisenbacteria bacterium]